MPNLIDCVMCVGVWWVSHRVFIRLNWALLTRGLGVFERLDLCLAYLTSVWRPWRKMFNAVLWCLIWLIVWCVWVCDESHIGIYWIELDFINNYKEPQLWLVLLRYSANVASVFPWVVISLLLGRSSTCTLHN